MMKIRRVKDLATYLEIEALTPESLGNKLGISNMTIRRLLKKNRSVEIPLKYQTLFDRLSPMSEFSFFSTCQDMGFEPLLLQIEMDGQKCKDADQKFREASKKAKAEKLGSGILSLIRVLGRALRAENSIRMKAIAAGALLYFLNPIDLIPDSIPSFGYIDDFAVLTIAASIARLDWEQKDKHEAGSPSSPEAHTP